MRDASGHCGRCGYLTEYHAVARRCPGLKTGTWVDRDPIDRTTWREILARDLKARTLAYQIDPNTARNGPPAAYLKLMQRAVRIVTGVEQPTTTDAFAAKPMVVARPPSNATEFASYGGRQAAGLGRLAARMGMEVAPYYWKSAEGAEGCAVKGHGPMLAFVATWRRKERPVSGLSGWSGDIAYAWVPGAGKIPAKVGHEELERIVRGEQEQAP